MTLSVSILAHISKLLCHLVKCAFFDKKKGIMNQPPYNVQISSSDQALLEMADVSSAQAMVNYYTERPPQLRGRTVYVQFSNHEQLKTESTAQVNNNTCAFVCD